MYDGRDEGEKIHFSFEGFSWGFRFGDFPCRSCTEAEKNAIRAVSTLKCFEISCHVYYLRVNEKQLARKERHSWVLLLSIMSVSVRTVEPSSSWSQLWQFFLWFHYFVEFCWLKDCVDACWELLENAPLACLILCCLWHSVLNGNHRLPTSRWPIEYAVSTAWVLWPLLFPIDLFHALSCQLAMSRDSCSLLIGPSADESASFILWLDETFASMTGITTTLL